MTTIDLHEPIAGRQTRNRTLLAGLKRLWASHAQRRADRIELSRMDQRLLRDIGLEPGDLIDGLAGRDRPVWLEPMRRRTHDE